MINNTDKVTHSLEDHRGKDLKAPPPPPITLGQTEESVFHVTGGKGIQIYSFNLFQKLKKKTFF